MMPTLFVGIGALLLFILWPRKAAAITVGDGFVDKTDTADGLTRGERNNNPGNIADNPRNQWQGQIGSDGMYCIFDTVDNGIRAIAHTLKSYQSRGEAQTIHDMIYRYSSSDQAAYSRNVANALGLEVTDSPDLNDRDTLTAMVTAIIKQENGRVSYTLAQISNASQMG
jgi:hypothetical protein